MNSALLVLVVGVLYAFAAAIEAARRNFPMALVLLGYVIANLGLIWALARGG